MKNYILSTNVNIAVNFITESNSIIIAKEKFINLINKNLSDFDIDELNCCLISEVELEDISVNETE